MGRAVDIASTVSAELSALLEAAVNNPEAEEIPTLGSVREALLQGDQLEGIETYPLHKDESRTLIAELDALIGEFGSDMPAIDFVSVKASENLVRAIAELMDTEENLPTLGRVRTALLEGLSARLVGTGAIDPDDEGGLLQEVEALIQKYGEDALAEDLLRYE